MTFVAALMLVSCTSTANYDPSTNDPLEPLNRGVYDLNTLADVLILEPVSKIYDAFVPDATKQGVSNFLANLRSPIIFANDLLQGETERAATTFKRFLINSTIGLGGVMDFATPLGHPKHNEDFGQTLATYGVPDGPYLVIPFFGPSNARDAVGLLTDGFVIDPLAWITANTFEFQVARTAVGAVNSRHELTDVIDDLRKNAIDQYATVRSVYNQQRAAEILNGRVPPPETYEDIFDDDFLDEEFDDASTTE